MNNKGNGHIELARISITIVVTGQEDNKGAEKEDSRAEERPAFEDDQPGPSGVSNGGIGVPGPEDHCSNPPSVSSLPSVKCHS